MTNIDLAAANAMQRGDPNVIKGLEDLLASARSGQLVGFAASCALSDGRIEMAFGGQNPHGLYYGCDKVKAALSRVIEGAASPIIKVRGN